MVAQLQSQVTAHLEGLFSATEAQHPGTTAVHNSMLLRRLKQEGQKPPFTAAVREKRRKSPLIPPKCLQTLLPPTSKVKSKAAVGLALLSMHKGLSTDASDCTGGQQSNMYGLSTEAFITPHCFLSSLIHMHPSSTWSKAQGLSLHTQCLLPACRS